jgi:Amt family ammonium transporter
MIGTLRVSKEGELEGLDIHEHGGSAYPELMGAGSSMHSPMGSSGGAIGSTSAATAE